MKKQMNIHPGEILLEDFLKPMEISQYKLAHDIGVPQTRISQIVKGKRSISPDTALRLDQYFGLSYGYWMTLQMEYDLREAKHTLNNDLKKIPTAQFVLGAAHN